MKRRVIVELSPWEFDLGLIEKALPDGVMLTGDMEIDPQRQVVRIKLSGERFDPVEEGDVIPTVAWPLEAK